MCIYIFDIKMSFLIHQISFRGYLCAMHIEADSIIWKWPNGGGDQMTETDQIKEYHFYKYS